MPVIPLLASLIPLTTSVVPLPAPVVQLVTLVIQLPAPVVQLPVPGHGQGFCATGWVNLNAKTGSCGGDKAVLNSDGKGFVPIFINFIRKINDCPTGIDNKRPWVYHIK